MPESESFLSDLQERYPAIYTIVPPPRCSSTAFARVSWEHPSIRYHCHGPFEVTYYMGQGLDRVGAKLERPLDLEALKCFRNPKAGWRDYVGRCLKICLELSDLAEWVRPAAARPA